MTTDERKPIGSDRPGYMNPCGPTMSFMSGYAAGYLAAKRDPEIAEALAQKAYAERMMSHSTGERQ